MSRMKDMKLKQRVEDTKQADKSTQKKRKEREEPKEKREEIARQVLLLVETWKDELLLAKENQLEDREL